MRTHTFTRAGPYLPGVFQIVTPFLSLVKLSSLTMSWPLPLPPCVCPKAVFYVYIYSQSWTTLSADLGLRKILHHFGFKKLATRIVFPEVWSVWFINKSYLFPKRLSTYYCYRSFMLCLIFNFWSMSNNYFNNPSGSRGNICHFLMTLIYRVSLISSMKVRATHNSEVL